MTKKQVMKRINRILETEKYKIEYVNGIIMYYIYMPHLERYDLALVVGDEIYENDEGN